MEAERWQRVKGLFHEALERPTVERESFLDAACGADPPLRAELESLLEFHRTTGSFLEHGPTLPAELAIPSLEDDEDADSRIGQRLGAYEVVRTIGRGGMGTVYLARRADGQFSQDVAIKLVSRGMDTELLLRVVREFIPHGMDEQQVGFWAGLRPMTPDGPPILGPTRWRGLFLNSGHGSNGWTQACGTSRIVASLVDGRTPEIDLEGLTGERFGIATR